MSRLPDIVLVPGKPRKRDRNHVPRGETLPPIVPLAVKSPARPDPTPLVLNYQVFLNDGFYIFRGQTVLSVAWEAMAVVRSAGDTGAAFSLECFITYRALPTHDNIRLHGEAPRSLLESDRPERAFGRVSALRPPRWFAMACRDMLHDAEAHWARQKLAGRR